MKTINADIWTLEPTHLIVIPTNYGWRHDGSAVMGRGLARQATCRYPGVDEFYGRHCQRHYEKTGTSLTVPIMRHLNLLLAASKPLDKYQPWLSWKGSSNPDTIRDSLEQLLDVEAYVAVPLLGAGNGGLDPDDMLTLHTEVLRGAPHVALVLPPE